ncbi:MAG: DHHA1 domain-containing protein [Trueperaceae bacterium]|nr:DHHA1 domain-containing protein [Trueperaceae bacterium]
MHPPVDNRNERDYPAKIAAIAERLVTWDGPIVLAAHVDPDGDALGSTLTLKRALDAMGKTTVLPMDPPPYVRFLVREGEVAAPLEKLPDGALLAVLDVAEASRMAGAPLDGAAFVVNVDHHGTNPRFGDLALVQPGAAATAQIVKDIVDALPVPWTVDLATPCLAGILTDTGTFRFANTDREVLRTAGDLIAVGVDYAGLTDRLQLRTPSFYRMLGAVMDTLELPFDGRASLATVTLEMKERFREGGDDSDDYVGMIRYVEGVEVAALLKQKDDAVKVSMRARAPVSAQAICVELGGGGHVAAAGAKLAGSDLNAARDRVLKAIGRELQRHGPGDQGAVPTGAGPTTDPGLS